tara:strand:+ start:124 stop:375 length:252 start_codon:yes stop_codon:yes gene_type:complete
MDCYTSPGILSECISIYAACTDATLASGVHGLAAEGEDIKVIVMSFDEVMAALADGRINAAPAIVAIQWLALHRDEVRQRWSA